MEYLIIGNPRCGSGYAADIFTRLGLPTIHEETQEIDLSGFVGHSSWAFNIWDQPPEENPKFGRPKDGYEGVRMWAKNADPDECDIRFGSFEKIVVHLRNPFASFPSLIDENRTGWSKRIRFSYIKRSLGIDIRGNELEQAILGYLYYNRLALEKADFFFRIEHDYEKLRSYLSEYHSDLPELPEEETSKRVNSKPHSKAVRAKDWDAVSVSTKELLWQFCETYGYDYSPEILRPKFRWKLSALLIKLRFWVTLILVPKRRP